MPLKKKKKKFTTITIDFQTSAGLKVLAVKAGRSSVSDYLRSLVNANNKVAK